MTADVILKGAAAYVLFLSMVSVAWLFLHGKEEAARRIKVLHWYWLGTTAFLGGGAAIYYLAISLTGQR